MSLDTAVDLLDPQAFRTFEAQRASSTTASTEIPDINSAARQLPPWCLTRQN